MSWHTNGILIHSEFNSDPERVLAALGLEADEFDSDVSFDEAASSTNDGIAVGFAGGWTLIFGGVAMYGISSSKLAGCVEMLKKSLLPNRAPNFEKSVRSLSRLVDESLRNS